MTDTLRQDATAERLATEEIAWLTTVTGKGQPQSSPIWFLWDGGVVLAPVAGRTRPRSATSEANPRVSLHLSDDGHGGNVVTVDAIAELTDAPDGLLERYLDKYAAGIEGLQMTAEQLAADYPRTIRITPDPHPGLVIPAVGLHRPGGRRHPAGAPAVVGRAGEGPRPDPGRPTSSPKGPAVLVTGDDRARGDRPLAARCSRRRRDGWLRAGSSRRGRGRSTASSRSGGGVPKLPVDEAVIDLRGVVGDVQKTQRHHGRPWQALCLWSKEKVDLLAAEGHPITYGAAGENVSVTGIDWADVRPGVRSADRRGPGRVQPLFAAVRQEPTLVRGPRQHAHAPRDRAGHQPHVRLGARAGLSSGSATRWCSSL